MQTHQKQTVITNMTLALESPQTAQNHTPTHSTSRRNHPQEINKSGNHHPNRKPPTPKTTIQPSKTIQTYQPLTKQNGVQPEKLKTTTQKQTTKHEQTPLQPSKQKPITNPNHQSRNLTPHRTTSHHAH